MPRDQFGSYIPQSSPLLGLAVPVEIQAPIETQQLPPKNGSASKPKQAKSWIPTPALTFLVDSVDASGAKNTREVKAIALLGSPDRPYDLAKLLVADFKQPSGMRTITLPNVRFDKAGAALEIADGGIVDITRKGLASKEVSAVILAKGHKQLFDSVWPRTPRSNYRHVRPLP